MTTTTQIIHKPTTKKQVKTFQDLGTWKAAQELAIAVLRQCESFPEAGNALVSLMTEAASGICTTIAQGFNEFEGEERDCFYQATHALLVRLENYVLIARGMGYLNEAQQEDLLRRSNNTRWILLKLQKLNKEWAKNRR